MEFETNKYGTIEHEESGGNCKPGVSAKDALRRGEKAYGQAKIAVGDAYAKTARGLNKTYEKARRYGNENPRSAMFITLGIGIGVGYFLRANLHPSRNGRFARPVVHALSDIALQLFR